VLATLGAPAQPGQSVLSATSTTRQVSVALGADQQSEAAVGDQVTIALPNNKTTPGMVLSVGTVATSSSSGSSGSGSSSPTITVLVDPTEPAATGNWDQAPVDVTIVTGSVTNALVVPVDALLAQTGGGYAVEVVDSDGIHRLEDVSLGLFDDADGLVQVIGSGLVAGQRIVVPAL
jgi:multidrug efflux pump subunit AcrA (membrane-fusion protein)